MKMTFRQQMFTFRRKSSLEEKGKKKEDCSYRPFSAFDRSFALYHHRWVLYVFVRHTPTVKYTLRRELEHQIIAIFVQWESNIEPFSSVFLSRTIRLNWSIIAHLCRSSSISPSENTRREDRSAFTLPFLRVRHFSIQIIIADASMTRCSSTEKENDLLHWCLSLSLSRFTAEKSDNQYDQAYRRVCCECRRVRW